MQNSSIVLVMVLAVVILAFGANCSSYVPVTACLTYNLTNSCQDGSRNFGQLCYDMRLNSQDVRVMTKRSVPASLANLDPFRLYWRRAYA